MLRAVRITVTGVVQGVGFRPAITRLALSVGVNGYVKNLGGGEVEIWVEGEDRKVELFIKSIEKGITPTAKIEKIIINDAKPNNFNEFTIHKSSSDSLLISEVPPDISICEWCLKEILDKENRRYAYAFNSCSWCGPRYSIIESIPYDRDNTSWKEFPLCPSCLEEYNNVSDIRRFHGEGISCSYCGPRLNLLDNDLKLLNVRDPILEAAKLINEGCIVAVKGIGGYHLACLASDDEVVLKLRLRKHRPRQPFAIMALNLEILKKLVLVNDKAEKLLLSYERPILILPRTADANVSPLVAPGLNTLGVFIPYTGLHYLLLMNIKDKFAIMTSGNPTGHPMIIGEEDLKKLTSVADYFLVHNRRIINRVDDSVIRFTRGEAVFLRRGRGYAPRWIETNLRFSRPVIAFGSDLQSTGAIAIDNKIIPTQYIGDVDEYECYKDLEKYLYRLCNYYKINPKDAIIVSDLHPLYSSSLLAENWSNKYGSELIKVQHHKAHMASAMLDNLHDIDEPAVAITIDGAGYGEDGAIWGGEILTWDSEKIERKAHLEYQIMPGGDLATKYPARMLVSILSKILSEEEIVRLFERRGLIHYFPHGFEEFQQCISLAKSGRGQLTSSTGRVLDSVSVLLQLCKERTYEGEPAILLEEHASNGREIKLLTSDLINYKDGIIPSTEIIRQLVDLIDNTKSQDIAYTAQLIIGKLLGNAALEEALNYGSNVVYVSGGAAVNEYIIQGIESSLKNSGLILKMSKRLPPNDGCISAGQAFILKLLEIV
ncbi:MAG: carbamoyltransferase HypF [Nitrososphaerota archaeon]